MNRTVVINVVGLTPALIGPHTPHIQRFAQAGALASVAPAFPAVTCTAQSNYVTGMKPREHGIVANGWFNRELAEVHFWKQSNHVVAAPKIWDELHSIDPSFTCAKLFWWYNMYSSADYSITPRPAYPADGRKVFDIYSAPSEIRAEIKRDLGKFPFPTFWGPAAGVKTPQGSADACSRWIADSARWIEKRHSPTLSLIYLPHLDYNLQRFGPFKPGADGSLEINPAILPDLQAIDSIVGELLEYFDNRGVQVILLSEYGITNVDTPVHLNRVFRQFGWIKIKEELGRELLDYGASEVFAVADHQVAHIYIRDPALKAEVQRLVEGTPGVERVLDGGGKAEWGLDHSRAGDLVAVAAPDAWFTYYYWLDDAVAPDFARCVDIHRKPGYDPVELFLDPNIPAVKLKILWRLLQKRLGFRMLMDVIPLDASLVKGSHGRASVRRDDAPVFITSRRELVSQTQIDSTDVYHLIKRHVLH